MEWAESWKGMHFYFLTIYSYCWYLSCRIISRIRKTQTFLNDIENKFLERHCSGILFFNMKPQKQYILLWSLFLYSFSWQSKSLASEIIHLLQSFFSFIMFRNCLLFLKMRPLGLEKLRTCLNLQSLKWQHKVVAKINVIFLFCMFIEWFMSLIALMP